MAFQQHYSISNSPCDISAWTDHMRISDQIATRQPICTLYTVFMPMRFQFLLGRTSKTNIYACYLPNIQPKFRMRFSGREMCSDQGCMSVCLSVCSAMHSYTVAHISMQYCGMFGEGYPLVVHLEIFLRSVPRFRCYGNKREPEREMLASAYTCCAAGLCLWSVQER